MAYSRALRRAVIRRPRSVDLRGIPILTIETYCAKGRAFGKFVRFIEPDTVCETGRKFGDTQKSKLIRFTIWVAIRNRFHREGGKDLTPCERLARACPTAGGPPFQSPLGSKYR